MKNSKRVLAPRIFCLITAPLILVACSDSSVTDEQETAARAGLDARNAWKLAADCATEQTLKRGERLFQMCSGCHGIEEGEASPAGPSLYGIAGRPVGGLDSYPYTQAMLSKSEIWTVDRFDQFVASPQDIYPGTGMAYSGLKNSDDRAALIAYVATKSLKQ